MIPLSTRMRPTTLDEFVGQEHFLYKGSLLYNAIKNKTFDCGIFFGPSGTGKTTLARIVAKNMDAEFIEINASQTGTKELKEIIDNSRDRFYGLEKKTTYVYVDEIHRWNKLQQDSLLKAIEDGVIRFIGSTTENPYFSINNAILSRVRSIYEFKPLSPENLYTLIKRTLTDCDRGFGNLNIKYDEEALMAIATMCSGDARMALDTTGFIVDNLEEGAKIDDKIVQEAMQRKTTFYNREEDKYNLLSALQKSIRGSDPDAAIYYLAKLIDGGAELETIGRRLIVMASEDVGMAYPQAITIVTSCVKGALMVGFPEASINLAQAVITLASSPKSNRAYMALNKAMEDIKTREIDDIPLHIKDAHYKGSAKRGHGLGYKYPHDYSGAYVTQQYLPDNLYREGVKYYEPTTNGNEASFKKYLDALAKIDKENK